MIISNEAHVYTSFFFVQVYVFHRLHMIVSYICSRAELSKVLCFGFRMSKIARCLRRHRLLYFMTLLYFSHKMGRESFEANTKWIAIEMDTPEIRSDRFRFHFLQTQCSIYTAHKHVRKHVPIQSRCGHNDAPCSESSFAAPPMHPFHMAISVRM